MPRCLRKVIRVTAHDSPNVRLALYQQAAGVPITGEIIVPGVLSWDEFQKRLQTWDQIRQTVGLWGAFYEGAEILLFPPAWLNLAEQRALALRGQYRHAKAIGIDPAEGGDSTSMCAIDELGVIELVSRKTPDTSVITSEALAFMRKHGVPPDRVCIDRGGGGKQHADRLRQQGHPVRTVAFGETVSPDPRRGRTLFVEKVDQREERYEYTSRRAQMAHELRLLLDPADNPRGFAIPGEYTELRRQLAPIPLQYTEEGRITLMPKHKKPGTDKPCLADLLGGSPDEFDSLILACHAMLHTEHRAKAGALR